MVRITMIAAGIATWVSVIPAHSEIRPRIGPYDVPNAELTALEVYDVSFKVGVHLSSGYGLIGRTGQLPRRVFVPVSAARMTRTAEMATRMPATRSRSSPSLIDLSQLPPGYVPPSYKPDPGAYSAKLEARSLRMFPWDEQERQKWMAEQERREIANEINSSKPLLFPIRGD
jgi:hypothetical protein